MKKGAKFKPSCVHLNEHRHVSREKVDEFRVTPRPPAFQFSLGFSFSEFRQEAYGQMYFTFEYTKNQEILKTKADSIRTSSSVVIRMSQTRKAKAATA